MPAEAYAQPAENERNGGGDKHEGKNDQKNSGRRDGGDDAQGQHQGCDKRNSPVRNSRPLRRFAL